MNSHFKISGSAGPQNANESSVNETYAHPLVGYGYDTLASLLFAPLGGIAALRERAIEVLDVRAGMRVLELGCGTGGLTTLLLQRGADVTAVDLSEPMLRRARKRAPGATYVRADVTEYDATPGAYDRVLFAFVLHEVDSTSRRKALAVGRRALSNEGTVTVVDYAIPPRGLRRRAMSTFVRAVEPPSAVEWIIGGFDADLAASGLRSVAQHPLAHGAAVAVVAQTDDDDTTTAS